MKTETKRILEKAQAGDAEAQYLTGLYYEDKGNADEAFLWYDRSATQGFVYGINAVAIYYLKGMAVKHDTGKAIALLESIADKFHSQSQSGPYIPGRAGMSAGYRERYRVTRTGCGFR